MRTILKNNRSHLSLATAACTALLAVSACSPETGTPTQKAQKAGGNGTLNLYSARHYDADEKLYAMFEQETGIKLNRIEMKGDLLLERLKAEGSKSPADVILMVDAGNFAKAETAGLLQAVNSPVLDGAIPARLRDDNNMWFGFAKRARVIAYDKAKFKPEQVAYYADLSSPALKGAVCVRPSSNIYNLSLMGALMQAWGPEKAEGWAKEVVANFARAPEGNDTDQLKAIGEGKCGVAIVNHYYAVRLQSSKDPAELAIAGKLGLSFPDQAGIGTHVNIAGGALGANAPNKDNGVRFLEFLASPAAQKILGEANFEFPVLQTPDTENPALRPYLGFKEAETPLSVLGTNQAEAQKIFDRAGWK